MRLDIILAVVIGILVLFQIYREWKRLTDRIEKLEKAARLRMPHEAMLDILNAMAALDREQTEMTFWASMIENAKGHLSNALAAGTKREGKKDNEDV